MTADIPSMEMNKFYTDIMADILWFSMHAVLNFWKILYRYVFFMEIV